MIRYIKIISLSTSVKNKAIDREVILRVFGGATLNSVSWRASARVWVCATRGGGASERAKNLYLASLCLRGWFDDSWVLIFMTWCHRRRGAEYFTRAAKSSAAPPARRNGFFGRARFLQQMSRARWCGGDASFHFSSFASRCRSLAIELCAAAPAQRLSLNSLCATQFAESPSARRLRAVACLPACALSVNHFVPN